MACDVLKTGCLGLDEAGDPVSGSKLKMRWPQSTRLLADGEECSAFCASHQTLSGTSVSASHAAAG